MDQFGGGSWMMVPNPTQNMMIQDQQQHHSFNPQFQHSQFQHHHQHQLMQLQQQQQPPPPQQLQQQQQQQPPQSLASQFHLLPLVESLAEATENGTRDQHSDALVSELTSQFEKCQQLLNYISETIGSKAMTVEGQKKKLEETKQQLNQRRELISKYRSCVEELIMPGGSR